MSDEIQLSVDDAVTAYEPDFDVAMSIVDGKVKYWIVDRREQYTPNEKGGQDTRIEVRETEVSADVWRDAVKLLRVAEIRQLRRYVKEALDPGIEDTLASQLKRIADRTE